MVQINIAYKGSLRCEATHEPSGTTLLTDAPKDNQGMGSSFSPTDLLATALGTCMLTIMGIAARTHHLELDGTTVTVEKHMVAQPIRRVGKLAVTITVPHNLSADDKLKLERAALTCPVHQSLHPDVQMPITFNWG